MTPGVANVEPRDMVGWIDIGDYCGYHVDSEDILSFP